MASFTLIGCSECENLQIVKGVQKTTKCTRCNYTIRIKKAREFHKSEDKEEIKAAKGLYEARRAGIEEEFRDMIEDGKLNNVLEQESKDIEQTILDTLKQDRMTEEELVSKLSNKGFDCEQIKSTIQQLKQDGDIYKPKISGGYEVV